MIYIIIIIVAAAFVAFLLWKRRKLSDIDKRVFAIKNRQTLPSRLHLWIEKGVNQPTDAEVRTIENGMRECFERARAVGYDRPLDLGAYNVAIVQSIRAPESGIWAYKVPAGAYAGTEWDLGGYILAAGQMISVGDPHGNIIVLPDHHGTDLDELARVAGYEVEHIVLAYCDGDRFEATKIHSAATPHPLFGTSDAFATDKRLEMLRTGLIK